MFALRLESWHRERAATQGLGADVILDFVASDEALHVASASARMMADIAVVGLGGGSLPFSFFGVPYEASVRTTYWGDRAELVEVLDLAARGLLYDEISRFPLDEAAVAYEQLRVGVGAVDGRPWSSPTKGTSHEHHVTADEGLVVHESMFGNTEQVARAVARGLSDAGAHVTAMEVGQAPALLPDPCDPVGRGRPDPRLLAQPPHDTRGRRAPGSAGRARGHRSP